MRDPRAPAKAVRHRIISIVFNRWAEPCSLVHVQHGPSLARLSCMCFRSSFSLGRALLACLACVLFIQHGPSLARLSHISSGPSLALLSCICVFLCECVCVRAVVYFCQRGPSLARLSCMCACVSFSSGPSLACLPYMYVFVVLLLVQHGPSLARLLCMCVRLSFVSGRALLACLIVQHGPSLARRSCMRAREFRLWAELGSPALHVCVCQF